MAAAKVFILFVLSARQDKEHIFRDVLLRSHIRVSE